jgi:signal transduction histidine kinase
VAQGQTVRRESVHLRKDGMAFPVEVQLSPITHRGQAAILAAARDISARKQAEEALRKSEGRYRALSESLEATVRAKVAELKQAERLAAIGRMVSVVAHEIRNPLQNINLGVDALKTKIKGDQATREIFQEIDYGIDLLNVTVKELLDYAKPVQLQYSLISVGEMVRHAGKLAAPQPPNITIKTELEEEEKEIPVDVPKMTRALLNILSNAIEAMPNGGAIGIRSEMYESNGAEYLKLSISDDGPGMNEEQLERVFEPFFTTKPRGTGLGLAICKKIVDAHHGILRIHSKQGEGTTVEIILPASQE